MTGKSNRRMRVFPKKVDDVDPIIRWAVEARLRHIEEIVCGRDASGTDALSAEAAFAGILGSMGSDWKSDEADVEYYMQADMRGWWRDFPKQELLSLLYRRAARRKEGTGSDDSRRLPEPDEGCRVAKALLSDIRVTGRLDAIWEAAAVSRSLADLALPPIGQLSRTKVREYIKRFRSSPVHYDALSLICEGLDKKGEAIPGFLAIWRQEAADGRRKRPAMQPKPPHRPLSLVKLPRYFHIQFTIEVLDRLGIRPMGNPSGCSIVAEALALEMSERDVRRIWEARAWRVSSSFMPFMRKYRSLASPSSEKTASPRSRRRPASPRPWADGRPGDSRRRLADPRVSPAPSQHESSHFISCSSDLRPSTLFRSAPMPRDSEEETTMSDRLLRRPEVESITGLGRSSIYRFMKEGKFPQRVQVGPAAVRWRSSDIARWMDSRPLAGS